VLPHARDEIEALARHSAIRPLEAVQGWNVQLWTLTEEDVDRAVAAYQAILSVGLDNELEQLLADMGVDPLGPPATTDQHARVMRADAIELVAAATMLAEESADTDDLHMPNVPKMAGQKSDSGIDVVGIALDSAVTGPIVEGERLLLVSVKHTIGKYASSMRGKLERSVTDDLSAPYLQRQLTTLHGRLLQSGVSEETARRVFYFLRETRTHPQVRIVCVAAAAPPPECNLLDQPEQLTETDMPDAHFRMLLVPALPTLHQKLVPK
jgi:type IV pilus biogenesis protein CpaD/CtpE